jgi:hypothetical protein
MAPKHKGGSRTKQIEYSGFPRRYNDSDIMLLWQHVWSSPVVGTGTWILSITNLARDIRSIERVQIVILSLYRLRMVVNYWLPDDQGSRASFRPGDVNADTMHFDFISGWDVEAISKDI